ncbi:MAG: triose-phosphate isomerase [Clostridiales bacterium]|jgi:triosephosphate isomerase|nr:triose-phosphate isomerase [Clostridiales bacterium]
MKKFLIAGNWKMNMTTAEAVEFANELKAKELGNEEEVAIIAPFTQLEAIKSALKGSDIKVGAQNVHYEESGAYTGEISVDMLKEIGVDYCVIGHSERRQYFNETDSAINLKLKALIKAGIKPILCVGESLEIREAGNENTFVATQVMADIDGLSYEDMKELVIAYEPIWAIGTGKTATPEQAADMCGFIRGLVGGLYDNVHLEDSLLILYGGSMKPSNAKELLTKDNIDGGLIGGASLKVDSFAELADIALSCR